MVPLAPVPSNLRRVRSSLPLGKMTAAETAHSKMLADLGAWAGNVSTSVFIVFVNKLLMKHFAYRFATTLVSHQRASFGWKPALSPPQEGNTGPRRSIAFPSAADRAAFSHVLHQHLVCPKGRHDQADHNAIQW